jgi:hypothetical protein
MAHERGYGGLGETEVVGYTGEAVAKDMRRKIFGGCVLEQFLPVFGKADERLLLFGAGKHENLFVIYDSTPQETRSPG